jgi:diguanylate cyclase (GGDEF)-like protein
MIALDEFWPKGVGAIRSITTEIVAAIVVSAFLTSLLIALRVSVACTTLTAGELWPIILSVSAVPTILIDLIIGFRMRGSLKQIIKAHQQLVCLACIDGLTGLLNRPGFDAVASDAFTEAQRSGRTVSALVCDIDAFRALNNRYGHLAQVLEESMGSRSAIFGRLGSDELVILLPGIDIRQAVTIAEGLCEACEARALVQRDPAAKFTISVGVGMEESSASELGDLLTQTDAALYRAKRAGGNQVASGPGLSAQRQAAPDAERFPMRCAGLVVPLQRGS